MNEVLQMKTVMDKEFNIYGRVLDVDTQDFVKAINAHPVTAQGEVVYEPSVAEFEQLPLYQTMENVVYGQMPVEFGHCSGWNNKLNALEYHRSSEIDIAATDLILMVGLQQDIDLNDYTVVPRFFMQALVLANDSHAMELFPDQYRTEQSLLDSFMDRLEAVKDESLAYRANSTFIDYHSTYYWFSLFRTENHN